MLVVLIPWAQSLKVIVSAGSRIFYRLVIYRRTIYLNIFLLLRASWSFSACFHFFLWVFRKCALVLKSSVVKSGVGQCIWIWLVGSRYDWLIDRLLKKIDLAPESWRFPPDRVLLPDRIVEDLHLIIVNCIDSAPFCLILASSMRVSQRGAMSIFMFQHLELLR